MGRAGWPLHAWEQWSLPRAACGGLLLSLAGSAPAFAAAQVCTIHDAAVFDHPRHYGFLFCQWYRMLFRRLAHRAKLVLTVSAFSRERLRAVLGAPELQPVVLGAGAEHLDAVAPDTRVLVDCKLESGAYFVAVGSLQPGKNLEALVQAFAPLAASGLRLVVAGAQDRRVFGAAGLPASAGVVLAGPLDDGALKALYQNALALVFPSTYEGFGLPPLEAMACGCPVAAARKASIPEVCGDAALYFDPCATAEITAAMQQLAGDAGLRRRLAAAGRERARGFSWDQAAARLHEHLLPLLGSASIRGAATKMAAAR